MHGHVVSMHLSVRETTLARLLLHALRAAVPTLIAHLPPVL